MLNQLYGEEEVGLVEGKITGFMIEVDNQMEK
jgi:hypothetical protein